MLVHKHAEERDVGYGPRVLHGNAYGAQVFAVVRHTLVYYDSAQCLLNSLAPGSDQGAHSLARPAVGREQPGQY